MKTKQIEIQDVLHLLGEKQILSSFRQKVVKQFMQVSYKQKYFNEIVTYISPKLIGGKNAPTFVWRQWFSTLQDALSLEIQEMKQIGDDIKNCCACPE